MIRDPRSSTGPRYFCSLHYLSRSYQEIASSSRLPAGAAYLILPAKELSQRAVKDFLKSYEVAELSRSNWKRGSSSFSRSIPGKRQTREFRLLIDAVLRLKHDLRVSWRMTRDFLLAHRAAIGACLVATAIFAIFVGFPNDPAWFGWLRAGKDKQTREIARLIGDSGGLAQYNFLIVIGLWAVGRVRRSRFLQRLALLTFLSTFIAGAFCNVFRFSVGRPRPFTKESHLAFKGPQGQPKFHGFPSGHTSTAFGTAIPLLIALPEVGVPATMFAGAMAWARVYNKQHYPTDVIVGAIIGILAGIASGWPMLKVRRRLKRGP